MEWVQENEAARRQIIANNRWWHSLTPGQRRAWQNYWFPSQAHSNQAKAKRSVKKP
jgi:hypothetical protein